MSAQRKYLAAVKKVVEDFGLNANISRTKSGHLRVTFGPKDNEVSVVTSGTAGDARSILNFRSLLRRRAEEAGIMQQRGASA